MALIVETGAIVPSANTYLSLVDAQALVAALGYTVTLTEAHILKAMAQLNTLSYCGYLVNSTYGAQPLPFPRSGVLLRSGVELPSTVIPDELKNALAILAAEIANGKDPTAARSQNAVQSEKVDVISITYAPGSKRGFSVLDFPLVESNLEFLVCGSSGISGRIDRA